MFSLEELYEIKASLEYGKHVDSYLDEVDAAIVLVDRAIAGLTRGAECDRCAGSGYYGDPCGECGGAGRLERGR